MRKSFPLMCFQPQHVHCHVALYNTPVPSTTSGVLSDAKYASVIFKAHMAVSTGYSVAAERIRWRGEKGIWDDIFCTDMKYWGNEKKKEKKKIMKLFFWTETLQNQLSKKISQSYHWSVEFTEFFTENDGSQIRLKWNKRMLKWVEDFNVYLSAKWDRIALILKRVMQTTSCEKRKKKESGDKEEF